MAYSVHTDIELLRGTVPSRGQRQETDAAEKVAKENVFPHAHETGRRGSTHPAPATKAADMRLPDSRVSNERTPRRKIPHCLTACSERVNARKVLTTFLPSGAALMA